MSSRTLFSLKQRCRSVQTLKNWISPERIFYNHLRNATSGRKLSKPFESVHQSLPNNQMEKNFHARLKQKGYFYITDPLSAESLASHLSENWKEGYIFEANPGLGVLTKAILNAGVPCLRVFEENIEFLPVLQALENNYNNLEIINVDFLSLPSLATKALHKECNELDIIFSKIPEYSWNDGVPFRVFAIVSSKKSMKFIRYLLAALSERSGIFSFGRCEFFFLLTEKEYKCMNAEPKGNYSTYRWATVLYNLFFEIKCLDKFSSDIFFPLPVRKHKKKFQEQQFYLVKLTPKPDLFSTIVNNNKLEELYFFVRHLLAKRSSLVIPTMERWIPYCGPRLIKEGMTVFTKFGDLSPNQLVLLFNQFSSWSEYKNSTFHFAMQQFHAKKGLSHDEDENV